MNQEIIAELKTRIKNNKLEDDTDLLLYVQISSRLKALGDSSVYDEIEKISKRPEYVGRLEEMLKDRCVQGIWDVNEQSGEELGFSIVEAQDFWLYYNFSKNKNYFSKKLHPWFESWADEANHAEITEETQDVLERFLETYPIPEEQQLGVMAAPVTEFMCDVLEDIASQIPIEEIHGVWQKPTKDVYVMPKPRGKAQPASLYMVACDDGEIPELLLRQHDNLFCNVATPAGTLRVCQVLQSSGVFVVKINTQDGSMPPVDTVRVGVLPAFNDAEHPGYWSIDLNQYDSQLWSEILNSPIVITQYGRFVLTLQMPK